MRLPAVENNCAKFGNFGTFCEIRIGFFVANFLSNVSGKISPAAVSLRMMGWPMRVLRQSTGSDHGCNDELTFDHGAGVGSLSGLARIFASAVGVGSLRPMTTQLRDNDATSYGGGMMMDDNWLPTLETSSPQEGIELAVKLSRLGMMLSQSSNHIDKETRGSKTLSPAQLIAAAHVIALNFQTIAAANDWWRHESVRRNGG